MVKMNIFSFFKFPNKGTTSEVGGMISASRRKNTVSESRMEIERLTWSTNIGQYRYFTIDNSFKYLARIEMKPLEGQWSASGFVGQVFGERI